MAVAPLFVANKTTLNKELRLSGVQAGVDAEAIIDGAIEQIRIRLYHRLGASRVTAILATGYTENPTTTNTIIRAAANRLEVILVKIKLLCDMPVLFMDSSGGQEQIYNEEGLARELDLEEIRLLRQRLERDAEELWELVEQTETLGTDQTARAFTTETQLDPKPTPGDSIGRAANFDGNYIEPEQTRGGDADS